MIVSIRVDALVSSREQTQYESRSMLLCWLRSREQIGLVVEDKLSVARMVMFAKNKKMRETRNGQRFGRPADLGD